MLTSSDWLDRAKAARKISSDYRLAKELGTRPNMISMIRSGSRHLSREQQKQIAEWVGVDYEDVYLSVEAEKAKDPELREALAHALRRMDSVAASFMIGALLTFGGVMKGAGLYILCKIAGRPGRDSGPVLAFA